MKKIICLILSVVMMFSALSISAFAADVIRYGDVNADGVLDTVDLLKLRQRVARVIGNNDINRTNADINADGTINAMDVNYLRQHLVKKKLIVIPGFITKVGVFFNKFLSNKVSLRVVYNIQKKKASGEK